MIRVPWNSISSSLLSASYRSPRIDIEAVNTLSYILGCTSTAYPLPSTSSSLLSFIRSHEERLRLLNEQCTKWANPFTSASKNRSSGAALRVFPSREIAAFDRSNPKRLKRLRFIGVVLRGGCRLCEITPRSREDSLSIPFERWQQTFLSLESKSSCTIIKKLWKNISRPRIIRDITSCSKDRS